MKTSVVQILFLSSAACYSFDKYHFYRSPRRAIEPRKEKCFLFIFSDYNVFRSELYSCQLFTIIFYSVIIIIIIISNSRKKLHSSETLSTWSWRGELYSVIFSIIQYYLVLFSIIQYYSVLFSIIEQYSVLFK